VSSDGMSNLTRSRVSHSKEEDQTESSAAAVRQPTRAPSEAAILALQRTAAGNRAVSNLLPSGEGSSRTGSERLPQPRTPALQAPTGAARTVSAPDAKALIASQYPHLAAGGLSEGQIATVQKVLNARFRIQQLRTEYPQDFLSENEAKRAAIDEEIHAQAIIAENRKLDVPTQKLLADDVLADKGASSKEVAFRDNLYLQMIAYPTTLELQEGLAPKPLFRFLWGPKSYAMETDGGQISFMHLLKIDEFHYAYFKVLGEIPPEVSEEVRELVRDVGLGRPFDVEGKKVGEIHHLLRPNTSVKVGAIEGEVGGYPDDRCGRDRAWTQADRTKGARIILKAPDGWLHVYTLEPDLKADELMGPDDDGYVYLLDEGREVGEVLYIRTAEGIELLPGATKKGLGWRIKADLSKPTAFGQAAIGAFFGDWMDDPSFDMLVGQMLIGLTPAGIVGDVRDIWIAAYKTWTTGGRDAKLQLFLAIVAIVPVLDILKWAHRRGGKRAAVKALEEAAPRIKKELAKEAEQDVGKLAARLGIKETKLDALKTLSKDLTRLRDAALKGGKDAEEYARKLGEVLDKELGGDVATMVAIGGGGDWAKTAKALAASPAGEKLGDRMYNWRLNFFENELKPRVASQFGESGLSRGGKKVKGVPPGPEITGSKGAIHDLDMSYFGPDASARKRAAVAHVEERFGPNWKKLLDAEIMTDPQRLHLLEFLESAAAKDVEKAMVKESELNVLAKMIREGKSSEDVVGFAKNIGVTDIEAVTERGKLIKRLADNRKMYERWELELDDLHAKFSSEQRPGPRKALAKEIATKQAILNAATEGPYMTPGGALRHVSKREGIGDRWPAQLIPMSPGINYMAFLDDLYMLEHVNTQLAKDGFTASTAKAMLKYTERLLVSAEQNGVDMSKGTKARQLFDIIQDLIEAADNNYARLVEARSKALPHLEQAKSLLKDQLDGIAAAVKENTKKYLGREEKDFASRTVKILLREAMIVARFELRVHEAAEEERAVSQPASR